MATLFIHKMFKMHCRVCIAEKVFHPASTIGLGGINDFVEVPKKRFSDFRNTIPRILSLESWIPTIPIKRLCFITLILKGILTS